MSRPRVLRLDADTDLRSSVRELERELAVELGIAVASQAARAIARQALDMQRELRELCRHGGRDIALDRELSGDGWAVRLTTRPPSWTERLRHVLGR